MQIYEWLVAFRQLRDVRLKIYEVPLGLPDLVLRLVALARREAVVEADHPIIGQELRMREPELLAALGAALGEPVPTRLRVTVRRG